MVDDLGLLWVARVGPDEAGPDLGLGELAGRARRSCASGMSQPGMPSGAYWRASRSSSIALTPCFIDEERAPGLIAERLP